MIGLSYISAIVLAFFLGVVDAGLGMGYGTVLTPVLLMLGFKALHIVPAVLVSQLVGDLLGAFFHHEFKNVDLSLRGKQFRLSMVLGFLSVGGAIIAVLVAVRLPATALNLYIGSLVTITGILVLLTRNRMYGFSWPRLVGLGFIAAFNKGISGGGYGPIVTAGQMLGGVDPKNAVGVTCLAEALTCIVAMITYILAGKSIDWQMATLLSIGVALSTPVAAFIISKVESKRLKVIIGVLTLALGQFTIVKAL